MSSVTVDSDDLHQMIGRLAAVAMALRIPLASPRSARAIERLRDAAGEVQDFGFIGHGMHEAQNVEAAMQALGITVVERRRDAPTSRASPEPGYDAANDADACQEQRNREGS